MTDVLDMVKAVLATTAPRWLNMTKTLPVDLLNRQPAAGEWSATECLIHLLDTEHIFPVRVQAILAGQAIPAFDPDTQGTKNTASSPEQLANEFASLRQASFAVLERVTTQDFNRTAEHSELGTVTLGQLIKAPVSLRQAPGFIGKCPTKGAGLALKHEKLPSILSTGTNVPGQTAPHLGHHQRKLSIPRTLRAVATPLSGDRYVKLSPAAKEGIAFSASAVLCAPDSLR